MEIVTLDNIERLLETEDFLTLTYDYGFKSRKWFKIQDNIHVQLSTGRVVTIPAGMTTDLSSVPKWLWSIERPFGDFLFAAIIHDYLYIYKPNGINRQYADKEMLIWSRKLNRSTLTRRADNYLRYFAVRAFGGLVWNKLIEV